VLQDSPFFTVKLGIKVLPAVVLFKGGVSVDRLVGFQQLGGRDDFSTAALEARLKAAGIVGGVRHNAAAAAGGEESEEEEDQTAASIRRGIVHKGSDDESSDFDE
jgi:thioredoxin-like negative regulator of GroEL